MVIHVTARPLLAALAVALAGVPAAATTVFDLTGNNTTHDASGNGADGTWLGTVAYAPFAGTTGFYLNGASSLDVAASKVAAVPAGQIVTLSAFAAPDGSSLASERIVDKTTVGYADGYMLDIIDDHFRAIVGGTTLIGALDVAGFTAYRVKAVYDGTRPTPVLSLYVNGALDGRTTSGAFSNGTQDLRIGVDSQGYNHFGGVIADAALTYGATVPEPATWALLVAGFGLVGTAARRRPAVAAA